MGNVILKGPLHGTPKVSCPLRALDLAGPAINLEMQSVETQGLPLRSQSPKV